MTLRIGGNYTRDDWHEFPRLLDDLLAAGVDPARLEPVQFSPVLPRSGRTAGHADPCLPAGDAPWIAEAALFLREDTLRRGFPAPKPSMGICPVELSNRLVVGHDGALYRCPAFLGWPGLAVGSLADGIRDHRESHALGFWRNDGCLDCAYLPLCFGGCRLLPMLREGRIEGPECRKAFLDATLEGMVLQDLRHRAAGEVPERKGERS